MWKFSRQIYLLIITICITSITVHIGILVRNHNKFHSIDLDLVVGVEHTQQSAATSLQQYKSLSVTIISFIPLIWIWLLGLNTPSSLQLQQYKSIIWTDIKNNHLSNNCTIKSKHLFVCRSSSPKEMNGLLTKNSPI